MLLLLHYLLVIILLLLLFLSTLNFPFCPASLVHSTVYFFFSFFCFPFIFPSSSSPSFFTPYPSSSANDGYISLARDPPGGRGGFILLYLHLTLAGMCRLEKKRGPRILFLCKQVSGFLSSSDSYIPFLLLGISFNPQILSFLQALIIFSYTYISPRCLHLHFLHSHTLPFSHCTDHTAYILLMLQREG